MMSAHSDAGNFSDHVNFLKSYVKRYPDNQQAWEALAKTQENAGQLTDAMETLATHRLPLRPSAAGHDLSSKIDMEKRSIR